MLSVDYSLSPDAKWPQALKEVLSAHQWLTQQCRIPSDQIIFMGSVTLFCTLHKLMDIPSLQILNFGSTLKNRSQGQRRWESCNSSCPRDPGRSL